METNRFKGHFLPDDKIPSIEEKDLGNGVIQLIVKYRDEDIIEKPKDLHIIPFMPREHVIDMVPVKGKIFPWHDFGVYAATSAPILFTLVFANVLVGTKIFLPLGIVSVLWFWFVFLVNTKLQK